jgi:hypothetical protein
VDGNGSRAREVVWEQHGTRGRRRALVRLYLLAGSLIFVVALSAGAYAVFGPFKAGGSWTVVGTISDIRHREVSFDDRLQVFIVATNDDLVAFADTDPASRERVYFCPSSGWFESPSGSSKFDGHGFYREGPAGQGLARVSAREEHGFVTVNASLRSPGAPASANDGSEPSGRYCREGFYRTDDKTGSWQPLPEPSGRGVAG